MDAIIIERFRNVLLQRADESMAITSLEGHLNELNKKQRKYLKRVGFKQFLLSHPNNFAILEENVYLVYDRVTCDTSQNSNSRVSSASSVSTSLINKASENTVARIKQVIKTNNSCLVCSDAMLVYAIGYCFHPICYKCSTKLRVLCDDKLCPVCRSELDEVVFTNKLIPTHELDLSSHIKNSKYGIYFRNEEMQNKHKKLLEHNCLQGSCSSKFLDFDQLEKHLKEKHGEYFCSLCLLHCKIFTSERKTYSTSELEEHKKVGDKDNSSFNGHPICEFCDQRYLDKDELMRHVSRHHSVCHICETKKRLYYRSDEHALWWDHHFSQHFACKEQQCFGDSSTVFTDELDLKAHTLQVHKNKKTKTVKRSQHQIVAPFEFNFQSGNTEDVTIRNVSHNGLLQTYGIVYKHNLLPHYGFIAREGMENDVSQNVFFTAQSCDFIDDSEDITTKFRNGERVHVQAMSVENHCSKWRAVCVTKVSDSNADSPLYILNYDSEPVSLIKASKNRPNSESTSEFPYLKPQPYDPFIANVSNPLVEGNRSWSLVTSSKPIPRTPTKSKETNKPLNQKSVGKKLDKVPTEGIGIVQDDVRPLFAFIKVDGFNRFEDNVYFNKNAFYQHKSTTPNMIDLFRVIKPGDKVRYILDKDFKLDQKIKSKYRAIKVWRYVESDDAPSTDENKKKENRVRGRRRSTRKARPTSETSLSSTSSGLTVPVNGDIQFPGFHARAEHNYGIYKKALGLCFGESEEESLLELETGLKSMGLLGLYSVLFCSFQINEKPKVFLHSTKLHVVSTCIELSCKGFCEKGIKELVDSGIKYNEVVFIDVEAGHYLILHKINEKLHSFTLHYAPKQW